MDRRSLRMIFREIADPEVGWFSQLAKIQKAKGNAVEFKASAIQPQGEPFDFDRLPPAIGEE